MAFRDNNEILGTNLENDSNHKNKIVQVQGTVRKILKKVISLFSIAVKFILKSKSQECLNLFFTSFLNMNVKLLSLDIMKKSIDPKVVCSNLR